MARRRAVLSEDELAVRERRDRMLLHYAWVPHRFDEDGDTWGGHDPAVCPGWGCALGPQNYEGPPPARQTGTR